MIVILRVPYCSFFLTGVAEQKKGFVIQQLSSFLKYFTGNLIAKESKFHAEPQTSENPEIRKSRLLKIPKSQNPEISTSRNVKVQNSKSRNLKIQKS